MIKRMLSFFLLLCITIGLVPATAFAADASAWQNDIGAVHPAVFAEYKGYYYALWEENGAITRHKADGSESKVLFSYGGIDDLNTLGRGDYYTEENMQDSFVNMAIYQDKIYVSVAKGDYAPGVKAKQYAAIYAMNLDGTDFKQVVKTSEDVSYGKGSGPKTDTWCIWNDRIYYKYGLAARSVNLSGGDMKQTTWKEYSDKINTAGAGEVCYFYGDEAYLAMRSRTYSVKGDAPETEFFLRKVSLQTSEVTQYKSLKFKATVSFVADGWVYIHNTKNEWWRVKADGSQESGEYLGGNISKMTAHNGDLYYIEANTKTAYKSNGLGPVTPALALSKPEEAKDLIIAGNYLLLDDSGGRSVTDLGGSKQTFSLAYMDQTNYMNSSLVKKTSKYVYRPTFKGAAAEAGQVETPASLADTYFENGRVKPGWYNLGCLYKYINIDAKGNAELRYCAPTTAYYIEAQAGDRLYTIKNREGKYLSISGEIQNGARVTTSDTPYTWQLTRASGTYSMRSFILRPADNLQFLANASEDKFIDGTNLILWNQSSNSQFDIARNSYLELYPLDANGKEVNSYTIKMSSWAYPSLSYYENNPMLAYGADFTKPMTRIQMATAIMAMTYGLTGQHQKYMPGVIPEASVPDFTDTADSSAWYLAYWGITNGVGDNKFDPNGLVTREQMASFLMRTMNYYNTKLGYTVPQTKGNLSQFKDAGNVSSWAKDAVAIMVGGGYMAGSGGNVNPSGNCTIEQALILCDRVLAVYKNSDSGDSNGNGTFTIESKLGGYLTINENGLGVINKTQSQTFTRTFVRDGIYTLKTADGKYLAISGLPEDGKQLTVQAAPYEWYITSNHGAGDALLLKPLGSNGRYFLNVSGFSKEDGAPVIVYTSKTGVPDPNGSANFWAEDNERFVFKPVK